MRSLPNVEQIALRRGSDLGVGDVEFLKRQSESGNLRGREWAFEFVLDAEANAFDALAGRKNPLADVCASSRRLRAAGVPVRWLVPLCPELVFRLEGIFSLAADEGWDAVLTPALTRQRAVLESHAEGRAVCDVRLDADETLFAWDFVSYRLLHEDRRRCPADRAAYYRELQRQLSSNGLLSLPGGVKTVVIACEAGIAGDLAALHSKLQTTWPPLVQGGWSEGRSKPTGPKAAEDAPLIEIASVLFDGVRATAQWGVARGKTLGRRRGDVRPPNSSHHRVLVLGAYGGEHIGDTAILGGVLLRMHQRHGVAQAVLMTQRPAHTQRLVRMLDLPVAIEVELYEHPQIHQQVQRADAIVFAGGPLMDLPKQLVRHLYAVSLAERQRKPFFIEGVGAGPFVRKPSEWVARRLAGMAQRISVRTSDDSRHAIFRGCNPVAGRDPAFDYLATRSGNLDGPTASDRQWVDHLLEDAESRTLVGINVRPIRHEYTEGEGNESQGEYTRRIEAQFEQRLADGIRSFAASAENQTRFIFFPMNAIQFGLSDLRSAYRIQKLLGGDVDFRVWEADASIEGVLSLLRRLDAVVAMRFHAAIFALSQECPVVGIDYRVGRRDKVAALLGDFNLSDHCARIDLMTAEWLARQLAAITRPRNAESSVQQVPQPDPT